MDTTSESSTPQKVMLAVMSSSMRTILALLWTALTLLTRIMMVNQGSDGHNPGVMPIFEEFITDFFQFDAVWVRAYVDFGGSSSLITLGHMPARNDNPGSGGGTEWMRCTVRDVRGYVTRLLRPAVVNAVQPRNDPARWRYSIDKSQLWFRSPRAFKRIATFFEWKYFFWMHPTPPDNVAFPSKLLNLRRADGDERKVQCYNLASEKASDRKLLKAWLTDDHEVLMIYGVHVIRIPRGGGRNVPIEDYSLKRMMVALVLGVIASLGLMLMSSWFAFGFLVSVLPLIIFPWLNAKTVEQRRFFSDLSERVDQIELAARYLSQNFVPPGRSLDVRLCYRGIQAWCRCQPNAKRPRELHATWVEFMIPSTSSTLNRTFEVFDALVHTLLPWGHQRNWRVNIVYALITLYSSHLSLRWGITGILCAFLCRLVAHNTIWGHGDPWTFAWYIWICQLLSEGGASDILGSLASWFNEGFASG